MMPRLGRQCLYLNREQVASVGPSMSETIAAVAWAFEQKGRGAAQLPPKSALHPLDADSFIHAMPAWLPGEHHCGIKWVSGYPDNPARHGLPYISGLLILNDAATGLPVAVMDCTWITAQRTGAVSGLAARLLAPPHSAVAAILGAGVQARTQLAALAAAVPTLRDVQVYDVRRDAAERFLADAPALAGAVRVTAVRSAEEAVAGANIVVTAGPILHEPQPVIRREWLKEGVLGLPIDFDSMWGGADLDVGTYFVDDLAQYRHYQGQGYFRAAPEPRGDLGDLVVSRVPGRQSAAQRIVSMNLGVAICDMATASLIYERAVQGQVGTILDL
jgi:ornithine cyclodeaminase/alanine dehydrogenase